MAGGPGRARQARGRAGGAKRGDQAASGSRSPGSPVEKEYEFDTEDGKKTLAELFDGRSQLLAYNIMFGPDYTLGACPGCTSLADGLDGSLVHLNHRDVTLICFSRAPIERLTAYKQRMGWQFPYVSTYNTDFAFDFGLALTEEQAQQRPRGQGDGRRPARVARRSGRARSGPSSRTGCARTRAGSPSRARTGPSTTPTPCRRPTRSSRRTSASCSSERRSRRPAEPRTWRKDEYPD